MEFPHHLWEETEDRVLAEALVPMFESYALVLTDRLANTVYLNPRAEALFGDRAGALVNRLSFSLLGYGERDAVPEALTNALLGEGAPWRGVALIHGADGPPHFVEASAVRRGGRLVCGVLRLSPRAATG